MSDNYKKLNSPVEFSIDHTAISVSDLDISTHFYTEILGFTCERIIDIPDGNGRISLLKKADFTIEMFQFRDAVSLQDNDGRLADGLSRERPIA